MRRVQRKIKGFNDDLEIGELCQRCGQRGEDRRTLWHACFYAMDELDIPFERVQIMGHLCKQNGTQQLVSFNKEIPTYEKPDTEDDPHGYQFFNLRVCKECRADWMQIIKTWFNTKPVQPESCGSGIFIRRNGVNVEVTLEEWQQLQKEKNSESESD